MHDIMKLGQLSQRKQRAGLKHSITWHSTPCHDWVPSFRVTCTPACLDSKRVKLWPGKPPQQGHDHSAAQGFWPMLMAGSGDGQMSFPTSLGNGRGTRCLRSRVLSMEPSSIAIPWWDKAGKSGLGRMSARRGDRCRCFVSLR